MTMTLLTTEKVAAALEQMKHDLITGFVAPIYPLHRPVMIPYRDNLPDDQIAADLVQTADLIDAAGWTQGEYRDRDGFCITGALSYVTRKDVVPDNHHNPRYKAASEYLVQYIHDITTTRPGWLERFLHRLPPTIPTNTTGHLITWNDSPARTKREVVTTLRAAADQRLLDTTQRR